MSKLYDMNGNVINSQPTDEESAKNEQPQEELSIAEKLYNEYTGIIQTVFEKTLKRAEIQDVSIDQHLYMKILSTVNQMCMIRLMKFLSDDIGINDIDMIFPEKAVESMNKAIKFEKDIEATEEELQNLQNLNNNNK